MSNPCVGCKVYIPYRDEYICAVFRGHTTFERIVEEVFPKFSTYYCPCKNCLVKSICDNKKRVSIGFVLETIEDQNLKINPSSCDQFFKNLKRFAFRNDEIRWKDIWRKTVGGLSSYAPDPM
jgi:hypothetical protein